MHFLLKYLRQFVAGGKLSPTNFENLFVGILEKRMKTLGGAAYKLPQAPQNIRLFLGVLFYPGKSQITSTEVMYAYPMLGTADVLSFKFNKLHC